MANFEPSLKSLHVRVYSHLQVSGAGHLLQDVGMAFSWPSDTWHAPGEKNSVLDTNLDELYFALQ